MAVVELLGPVVGGVISGTEFISKCADDPLTSSLQVSLQDLYDAINLRNSQDICVISKNIAAAGRLFLYSPQDYLHVFQDFCQSISMCGVNCFFVNSNHYSEGLVRPCDVFIGLDTFVDQLVCEKFTIAQNIGAQITQILLPHGELLSSATQIAMHAYVELDSHSPSNILLNRACVKALLDCIYITVITQNAVSRQTNLSN